MSLFAKLGEVRREHLPGTVKESAAQEPPEAGHTVSRALFKMAQSLRAVQPCPRITYEDLELIK